MQRLTLSFSLLLLAVATVGFVAASSAVPATQEGRLELTGDAPKVTVPLEKAGNLLFVRVRINDTDAGFFLVDTGSGANTIDRSLARKLKLPLRGRSSVLGAGGATKTLWRDVESFAVGDAVMSRHLICDLNFAALTAALGLEVHGTVGHDFLCRLPFTIDYRAATLTFHRRNHFQPPARAHVEPLQIVHESPVIQGIVNGNERGGFDIDTGMDAGLIFSSRFASKHPDLSRDQTPQVAEAVGVGGTLWTVRAQLGSFDLFGRLLRNVRAGFVKSAERENPIEAKGTLGTIGGAILDDTRMTFDYAARQIWVEWLPEETPAGMMADGFDPDTRDFAGQTRLMRSISNENGPEADAWIATGANVNIKDNLGETVLMKACRQNNLELAKTLVGKGAEVNAKNSHHDSVLMLACRGGNAPLVEFLLDQRADLSVKSDLESETPLMIAAWFGHLDVVHVLLAKGADVNSRNQRGMTPLFCAALQGQAAIVRALFDRKADINAKDRHGATPLMAAARAGHAAAVRVLLEQGADPEIRDSSGRSALTLAISESQAEIAELLRKAGATE